MNSRIKISGLLVGIVAMAIMTILMWDISLFLGVVLLIGLIAMIIMYIIVCIEPNDSMYDEDYKDY